MLDKAFGVGNADQYYFQIKLATLKRHTEGEPFSFRISIQKGLQKVDSTKDLFTIEGSDVDLSDQPLNFYLPSFNPNRSVEFSILLLDEKQQEISNFKIGSGQFISEFIKTGKNQFTLSDRFEDDTLELDYSLYIEKSRAALFALTKRTAQQTTPVQEYRSPEKEEPAVSQPTRSQIARSPVVTRTLTPKKPAVAEPTPTKTEEEAEVIQLVEEPVQEAPKPTRTSITRNSGIKKQEPEAPEPKPQETKEARSPLIRSSQKIPPKAEPEPEKVEEPVPEPPKKESVRRPNYRTPVKQEPPKPVKQEEPEPPKPEPVKPEPKKIELRKVESISKEVKEPEPTKTPNREPKAQAMNKSKGKEQAKADSGNSGMKKIIIGAVLAAALVFGLMFFGGETKAPKKKVVGRRRK